MNRRIIYLDMQDFHASVQKQGGGSRSDSCSIVSRHLAQTDGPETLQLLLGHAELGHVDPYLQISKGKLWQAFAYARHSLKVAYVTAKRAIFQIARKMPIANMERMC